MVANTWTDILASTAPAQPRFGLAAAGHHASERPRHRAQRTRAPLAQRKYSLRNVTGCGGQMDPYRRSACLWIDQWAEKAPPNALRHARSTRWQPPPQQIPRLIVQLVHARGEPPVRPRQHHLARYRHGWRSLNPEYAYALLDDADCASFVDAVGTERHKAAYFAVTLGSQKADLFRAYWIALLGGIYADVDMELQRPLREWLPRGASGVTSSHWEFAFLAYAPCPVSHLEGSPSRSAARDSPCDVRSSHRVQVRAAAPDHDHLPRARGGRGPLAGHVQGLVHAVSVRGRRRTRPGLRAARDGPHPVLARRAAHYRARRVHHLVERRASRERGLRRGHRRALNLTTTTITTLTTTLY